MKTAHFVFERPDPSGSGARLRNYALGRALASFSVTHCFVVQDRLLGPKRHPARRRSFIEAALPAEVMTEARAWLQADRPDLVVVEGAYLADLSRLGRSLGLPTVIDMHNVESAVLRETETARYGYLARLSRRARWRRAATAEAALADDIGHVLVCSPLDADRVRGLGALRCRIDIVVNPVPAWCDQPGPVPDRHARAPSALFVGHLSYAPNRNAAARLVQRIWPALRQTVPEARLVIAGRAPTPHLATLAGKGGVRLVADPPDLAPLYAEATAALIPLREGGGTRLKVLEAMAVGLPVIASAKAVEGLAVTPGRTFLPAETDADFVAAFAALCHDPALGRRMAGRAFDWVFAHHGPGAVATALRHALGPDHP